MDSLKPPICLMRFLKRINKMQELITLYNVEFDGTTQQTVNARELHAFLEVGKDFSTWIKDRIHKYGFEENIDFVKIDSPKLGNQKGGDRRSIEYHISLSMAKELSMVERNSNGKQARQYFINCERKLKEVTKQPSIPQTLPEALRLAADLAEKNQLLLEEKKENAPKVQLADRFLNSSGQFLIRQVAKSLGVGVQFLFNWLRTHNWTMKTNEPYADKCRLGFLIPKPHTHTGSDGFDKTTFTTYITPKGVKRVHELLIKEGVIPPDRQINIDFLASKDFEVK